MMCYYLNVQFQGQRVKKLAAVFPTVAETPDPFCINSEGDNNDH